jgi:hypothetical protein
VQLLKIKLSEKDMLLNNLNLEYANKIDYLEENLNETHQQNQMLNAHLNDIVNVGLFGVEDCATGYKEAGRGFALSECPVVVLLLVTDQGGRIEFSRMENPSFIDRFTKKSSNACKNRSKSSSVVYCHGKKSWRRTTNVL